jgi:hypothetical protein
VPKKRRVLFYVTRANKKTQKCVVMLLKFYWLLYDEWDNLEIHNRNQAPEECN